VPLEPFSFPQHKASASGRYLGPGASSVFGVHTKMKEYKEL